MTSEMNDLLIRKLGCTLFLVVVSVWPLSAQDDKRAIDGMFGDWDFESHLIALDPVGDSQGSFDIVALYAFAGEKKLNLCLEFEDDVNLPVEKEEDTFVLEVRVDTGEVFVLDFAKQTARVKMLHADSRIEWNRFFSCLPSSASDRFEMQIDVESILKRGSQEYSISISGSDEFTNSLSVPAIRRLEPLRKHFLGQNGRDLRIASFNTNGSFGTHERRDACARLLKFSGADVFCLQGELDSGQFDKGLVEMFGGRSRARQIFDDGVEEERTELKPSINAHWNAGCAIVTRHKLTPIESSLDFASFAVVETGEERIVVASVCFERQGGIGSTEDRRRISQAEQLAALISKIRKGEIGEDAQGIPVVIGGTLNITGARSPIEILGEAGFKEALLRSPLDGSTETWRNASGEDHGWPRRLDFLLYELSAFRDVEGVVFDTEEGSNFVNFDSNLRASDSLTSNHLLIWSDIDVER